MARCHAINMFFLMNEIYLHCFINTLVHSPSSTLVFARTVTYKTRSGEIGIWGKGAALNNK